MKVDVSIIGGRWPVFLFLLPVFYFLHAGHEYYSPGLAGAALWLILLFTAAGFGIAAMAHLLIRNFRKSCLLALFLIAFNFFFGYLQDLARSLFGKDVFFLRYMFIIAALLILVILLIIWLRKTGHGFIRTYRFVNVLFAVLILFELSRLLPLALQPENPYPADLSRSFQSCDTCNKPDVYVIIADEYAGEQALNEVFGFDNSGFLDQLRNRGFHIVDHSASNYNATVYSMASLFSMDRVGESRNGLVTQRDMLRCRSIINNNNIGRFFSARGYTIRNHSFFDLQGAPHAVTNHYFHPRTRILTFGTFINRFRKEAGYNFFSRAKRLAVYRNDFMNDETVDRLLKSLPSRDSGNPRFVYAHFTRPHHPYYVDRYGNEFVRNDSLRGFEKIRFEYTEHLRYTNNRLLELLDIILQRSQQPPVILLASDHGFRQYSEKTEQKYYFMNLCAILLPGKNYKEFYEGMTTVNTFRAILNAEFGQQLPMLKDSSVFLNEISGH